MAAKLCLATEKITKNSITAEDNEKNINKRKLNFLKTIFSQTKQGRRHSAMVKSSTSLVYFYKQDIHIGKANVNEIISKRSGPCLSSYLIFSFIYQINLLCFCSGIIYRDLKPENVLLQSTGHVSLTDFDLSCLTSCKPQLLIPDATEKKKSKKGQQTPIFMADPMRASNSFVGTEEYIAPEIITGAGHTSAVDWWALVLLYEMLYGYTPFRGKTRQKTFANILHKDLKFPGSIPASLQAKQLMYRLLHRDPKNRLGSREGANELKRHPFFRGINWALVRCMKPPKLEAPIFETTEAEKGDKIVDPELEDLQTNVF